MPLHIEKSKRSLDFRQKLPQTETVKTRLTKLTPENSTSKDKQAARNSFKQETDKQLKNFSEMPRFNQRKWARYFWPVVVILPIAADYAGKTVVKNELWQG